MVKFFQKLKARKGFTLVELIVVIAIIGVLAAILIPTMLGYVTSSRVTSANSTAASIKNNIDTFLTNCDTAGYGMKLSENAKAELQIVVDADGQWTVEVKNPTLITADETEALGEKAFKSKGTDAKKISWTTAKGTTIKDKKKVDAGNVVQAMLAYELRDLFPEVKGAAIVAYLEGGKTKYVLYSADTTTCTELINSSTMKISETFKEGYYEWDEKTAGVNKKGFIVGSAPALTLKPKAAT